MLSKFRRDLDPLDLELLERAWVAVKENDSLNHLDSDEALEAILRLELIEIARFNGVSDAETLRDVCLASDEARKKYEATLKANRAELGLKP
jgi:hypothetical protein